MNRILSLIAKQTEKLLSASLIFALALLCGCTTVQKESHNPLHIIIEGQTYCLAKVETTRPSLSREQVVEIFSQNGIQMKEDCSDSSNSPVSIEMTDLYTKHRPASDSLAMYNVLAFLTLSIVPIEGEYSYAMDIKVGNNIQRVTHNCNIYYGLLTIPAIFTTKNCTSRQFIQEDLREILQGSK